ncbi:MAG: hypothetical protein IJE43_22270 [Alphaproteobacteria bacterium]|nr:hypothetical protein [Alphaproteobacteria bacterium]MBQ6887677.1 hypothetical protein [Lachnospiraceae bacterium]
MEIVDISDFESQRVRTLLCFLNDIYKCELQPDENIVNEFIETYIPEARDFVFSQTNGCYRQLNNLKFVTEKRLHREEYDIRKMIRGSDYFNSGIYNICNLLVSIDRDYHINFEILEKIELGEYTEAAKLFNDKISNLIIIQLGVSNYIIEINQKRNKFDFAKHYNVAPDINNFIVRQRNLQYEKNIRDVKQEHDMFVSDIMLFFELSIIKRKNDVLKLMMALICLCKSYEYDEYINNYAEIFIDMFQEIMFCGEIHKIYVQQKKFDKNVPADERGSKNATTRISIIFSAGNNDIFILRIDLPHKGEKKLHLNMHECVNGEILPTGYPLEHSRDNIKMLRLLVGENFDTLFYLLNNHIWFRCNFENRLNNMEIEINAKSNLAELFYGRCHYAIDLDMENEEKFWRFTDELQEYISNFSLKSNIFCAFDKDTIDYSKEIKKIRLQQNCLDKIVDVAIESCNESIEGNKSLWEIFSRQGLDETISEEDFLRMDFSKCWEYIDKFIL